MILEKIAPAPVQTQSVEKKSEAAEQQPQARNESVIWLGSALISQSMRLANYGEKIQDAPINKFCEQLKLFEEKANELDFTEAKLIQFLIRDWIIELLSKSRSTKLLQIQNILRQADINGAIAGRKRTIHDISQYPHRYPTAAVCLKLIYQVTPSYAPTYQFSQKQVAQPDYSNTDELYQRWLIPSAVLWIIICTSVILF